MTPFESVARAVADAITYKDGYRLLCERDRKDPDGRLYYQVACRRPDCVTGVVAIGYGGKAYLSEHMTFSELVRRAFGLFLAYEEHECREFFRCYGQAVFGPHISVEALLTVADRLDVRSEPPAVPVDPDRRDLELLR